MYVATFHFITTQHDDDIFKNDEGKMYLVYSNMKCTKYECAIHNAYMHFAYFIECEIGQWTIAAVYFRLDNNNLIDCMKQ